MITFPFLEAGYPAVRMTEPNEDFRHQHQDVRKENGIQFGDLPEFDDFNYIAQVARVNAASLGALALAPPVPAGVEIEAKELTNDTTLHWQANQRAGSRRLRSAVARNDFARLATRRCSPATSRALLFRFRKTIFFLASRRSIRREIAARPFTRCLPADEVFSTHNVIPHRNLICT